MNYSEYTVRASKQRALRAEQEQRMARAVKYQDFFDFNQTEYILKEMESRYSKTFTDIAKYAASVPLTRSMTLQLAKLFKSAPNITTDTENEAVNDAVAELFDKSMLFAKLPVIDWMVELHGKIGVMPYFNEITGRVALDIIAPSRCIVETYTDYPDTPLAVMYRTNAQSDNPTPQPVNLWVRWTVFDRSIVTLTADYEVAQTLDIQPNPYGKIPIVWFTKDIALDEFWYPGSNPIVAQNLRTDIQISNLDLALDYQAFSTLVTEGTSHDMPIIIGLKRHLHLPSGLSQDSGKAYYINPRTDLKQILHVINENIDMTAGLMGISTSAIRQGGNFSSGYQLRLSMTGVIDHNLMKREIFREPTRDLANLICECETYFGTKYKLPQDIGFNIDFAEITVESNPLEDEQILTMKLANGTISKVDAIMENNPDLTREEAEKRMAQINADNTKYSGRPMPEDVEL